jgi:hypothetical protein
VYKLELPLVPSQLGCLVLSTHSSQLADRRSPQCPLLGNLTILVVCCVHHSSLRVFYCSRSRLVTPRSRTEESQLSWLALHLQDGGMEFDVNQVLGIKLEDTSHTWSECSR